MAENSSAARWVHDVKGLGDKPTAVNLHVEGGAIWEIASAVAVPLPTLEPRAETLGTSNGSS